ncbi:uncharacterized protein ATNIH1004_008293 [Aspergillus tanneri]|uniref:Uncharacterized protein n=1 Tax=Aspergillus tanneri TaxID=1220188 RepID=A0A5M9MAM2_9EURO|nr:uncharacterized protein ATNIH1004_008293 [Aspergillus tanneri]KAA8644095.1 hypothetical protein ATNIH1004_008293 [Aspergillus tanneri]
MALQASFIKSRSEAILAPARIACSGVAQVYVVISDLSAEQRHAGIHFIDNNIINFAEIPHGNKSPDPGQYAAFEDLDSAFKDAIVESFYRN